MAQRGHEPTGRFCEGRIGGAVHQRPHAARLHCEIGGVGRRVLEAGCTLDVSFAREGGGAPSGGTLTLERKPGLFGLFDVPFSVTREFEGERVVIDGLAPMQAVVFVRFAAGDELSFEVDLEVGTKVSRFTL